MAGGGSFTFTPLTFSAGLCAFNLQSSNDGSTFTAISAATVPYTADGTYQYTTDTYAYKYIRLGFTRPTAGGLDMDYFINWRK